MSVEPEIQTDPHRKLLLTDHKLHFRNFYCLLWLLEGCRAPGSLELIFCEEIQLDTVENSKLPSRKNSQQAARAKGPHQSTMLLPNTTQTTHKRQVLRTKRWDCEDQLFLLHHTTQRLRLLLFSSFFYFVHYYHTIVPLSLSGPFSPLHPLPQSVTHTDSLCNMPGSKPNSTRLDLRPFRSS